MNSTKFSYLFILSLVWLQSQNAFSQVVAEKRLQGGITGAVGLNFPKMGTNMLESSVGFSSCFGVNFTRSTKESQNIAFNAGLEFDIDQINYKVTGTDVFYRFTDKQIKTKDQTVSTDKYFNLLERTYEPLYLTLPLGLTFRTDFIGDYRGVFKFGLRNRLLLTSSVNDKGSVVDVSGGLPTDLTENIGMNVDKDLFFYNGNLGLSAGVEWNFSGSTCLLIEAGFNYGFMPLHLTGKEQNYTLFNLDPNTLTASYFRNQATLNQTHLKFTLLF